MGSSPSVSFGNNRIIPKPWKKGKGPSTLFPCYRFPRDITIQQKMSGKRNSGKNSRPVWKAGREFLIPKPFQRLSGRRTQNQKALFLKEKQRFRRMMFVFQKNGVSLSKRMALAFPKEWRQPFLVISLFRGMDAHIRMPAINISQKPISREP